MARKQADAGRRARRTKAKTLEAPTRMLVLRLPRAVVEELDVVVKELQKEIPIVRLTASQILEHVVAQRLVGLRRKQERMQVVQDVQQELRSHVQKSTAESWRTTARAR